MKETMKNIENAENRIKEMEERRSYFNNMFAETGKILYKKLAESETDMIEEVREAIVDALLNK